MHEIKYEIVFAGQIHDSDIYASTTECPFLDIMKTMMVGSQACVRCEHHFEYVWQDQMVKCNHPGERKCRSHLK